MLYTMRAYVLQDACLGNFWPTASRRVLGDQVAFSSAIYQDESAVVLMLTHIHIQLLFMVNSLQVKLINRTLLLSFGRPHHFSRCRKFVLQHVDGTNSEHVVL